MMGSFPELGDRLLVIYDGHCGLCNRAVRWFLVRDQRDRLRFVPSESPRVVELLARHGFAETDPGPNPDAMPQTIVVVRDPGGPEEQALVRSDAVVALLAELPRPWPVADILLHWIPRPVRDLGYRIIARVRYRIWGRFESCPLPTAEERRRFL